VAGEESVTVHLLLLLGGFGALYFGADWMVRGAARLEGSLGLSPIVIGLTVVSLGTSAPEMVVAILATLQGSGDLAVGNVLGSNLANIGLILGATALVSPLIVVERVVRREIPIMLFITLMLYPLIMDMEVGRLDGMILCSLLAIYLTYVFYRGRKASGKLMTEYTQIASDSSAQTAKVLMTDLGLLLGGGLGLVLGGKAIVWSATFLARALGVTELVIGLTVVAIGTSLPELATSVLAALRRQTDLAVGNVIGSNIFNLAGVLGVAGIVKPISVDSGVLWVEFPAVLALSLLVLLVPIFPLAKGQYRIRRWEGAILLGAYIGLGWWVLGW
jgi:cation:H+ antiporter